MIRRDETVILHISDLHFGIEKKYPEIKGYRDEVLEKFKTSYARMIANGPNHAPDVLVVSGDIAFDGSPEDYEKAKDFFEYLLSKELPGNKLDKESIILCLGNHDMDGKDIKRDFDGRWTDYHEKKPRYRPPPDIPFDDF